MDTKSKERKEKTLEEMSLGELITVFIDIKDEYRGKLVNESDSGPYPEIYDKHGGPGGYNRKLVQEYKEKRQKLVSEIDKRFGTRVE